MRNTAYTIDPEDRIVEVDDRWIAFANANGAGSLVHRVLGQPLWTFIADQTVRELYRSLLSRVRATRRHVTLPFRCDSPTVRRYMMLSVGPGSGPVGTLAFCAMMVREEPQPGAARALYAAVSARSGDDESFAGEWNSDSSDVLTMCSSCKRLDVEGWCEIDEAIQRQAELLTEPVRPISHGLCPACRDMMLAALS